MIPRFRIDLYSDTKTRPTLAMRAAIAAAEVGDEQSFEDPTVLELTQRCARMLGQEDAVFLPSGTMANEIAVLLHCEPGDEIIGHENSHLFNFEAGAPAALAGAMIKAVRGERGMFDAASLRAAIRPVRRLGPRSRLVVVEQTANISGGCVWPLDEVREVAAIARENGLLLHLDGARLMNAAVALKVEPRAFGELFDTVFIDFSKGLGAPVGAVLAGSQVAIERAWRFKQRLGGSMRQAGILAAACLHALDHHVERLAVDHENARKLGDLLAEIRGIAVEPVATNMVMFDVAGLGLSADAFNTRLGKCGIRMSVLGPTRLRAVTHLDIDAIMIDEVARGASRIASEC